MDLLKETTPLVYSNSRNIRDIDIEAFKNKLKLINLDSSNGATVTDIASKYDKLTLDLLDEFAPIKNRIVRDHLSPGLIVKLMLLGSYTENYMQYGQGHAQMKIG